MKTKIAIGLLTWILALCSNLASAQSDMSTFLTAEKADASKLIGAYVSPIIKGVSYGMTSGWYHTGKTHKKFGVDFGVTLSAVMMPTSEQSFDPTKIGLNPANITPNQTSSPTIIGPKTTAASNSYTAHYNVAGVGAYSQSFKGPDGLDFKKNLGGNWVPVPMFQIGIGTVKNTDLKIRFIPGQNRDSKSGSNKISMIGFGLMHDIKQYFPGVKALPFDLSVLVAYNSVNGSTSLANSDQADATDGRPYSADGKVNYKFNSWVAQAIISKKISVLTFYAGIGYGAVNSKVNITGKYVLDPYAGGISLTDPFSTTYSNKSMKITTGMRLKFGPIYFNGDYTIQKYNALTVGFGASIR